MDYINNNPGLISTVVFTPLCSAGCPTSKIGVELEEFPRGMVRITKVKAILCF